MLIEVNHLHPEPRKIKRAVETLERGGVVGYPTDVAYALGCDLHSRDGIEKLYQTKQMERSQPLAFLCPDLSDLARYAVVDNPSYRLMRRILPGPYTVLLPASREVPRLLQSKRRTIGMRVPDNPVTLALIRALGRPILSTTAAEHGGEPLIDPRDVQAMFPKADIVLDGGYGRAEVTTVLDLSRGAIEVVRQGAGPIDDLFS